jgi:hypothetical protein
MIEVKPADTWHQVYACAFAAVAGLSAERTGG